MTQPADDSRIALVTGATSGIGFHTASELAARGATVLITGRDQQRGEDAVKAIASAAGHTRVEFFQADHSTVGANDRLGAAVAERLAQLGLPTRLDVLVNNVGAIFATRTVTADGYEATLAVNFLAPVVLTAAWTIALSEEQAGTGLAVATVNPGMAWTTMTAALTPQVVPSWRYVYPLVRFFQKRGDAAKAARVCVELAWTASPAAISGRYFTEHGKPGRYPGVVTDPAVRDQVAGTADDLARHAPTGTVA